MVELLLPRTDAAVLVQLVVAVAIGVPALVHLVRRRASEAAWLVGGILVFLLGFFALRTAH